MMLRVCCLLAAVGMAGCSDSSDAPKGDDGSADAEADGGVSSDAAVNNPFSPRIIEGPQTVDDSDFVGAHNAIAVDSSGNVHIVYYNSTRDTVNHATNAAGGWSSEIIATNVEAYDTGEIVDLVLDPQGHAHVAYLSNQNADPAYATNASGAWVTEPIGTSGTQGDNVTIGIAKDQTAHVAFFDARTETLAYGTNATGTWAVTTIDASPRVGRYASLAVDDNDVLHVSYYDSANDHLKYATNQSGAWVIRDVATVAGAGKETSIAVRGDVVRISYLVRGGLMVTDPTSRAAPSKQVAVPGTGGGIAIDQNGRVHASFRNANTPGLSYGTNALADLSQTYQFDVAVIDATAGIIGVGATDLAMGPDGSIHISYFDGPKSSLKYVRLAGP